MLLYWHFPYLKEGDSCFLHYCMIIPEDYHGLHNVHKRRFLYALRYIYFFRLFVTALSSRYFCLHSDPGHGLRDRQDIPICVHGALWPEDFYSRSGCKADCLDRKQESWWCHFRTRAFYMQASQRILTRMDCASLLWCRLGYIVVPAQILH